MKQCLGRKGLINAQQRMRSLDGAVFVRMREIAATSREMARKDNHDGMHTALLI